MLLGVLLLLYLTATAMSDVAQTCYFPDKTVSPADAPCNAASSGSACCNRDDICLDNNLCLQTKGYPIISRGSCTDETWQSPGCAQFCQDVNINFGMPIFPIDPYNFCCGPGFSSNQTCNVSTHGSIRPFEVTAGNVIFNRSDGSIGPNITTTGPNITYSSPNTIELGQNTTDPSSSSERKVIVAISAGVVAPLGITVFVLLGNLLMLRRRKRHLELEMHEWERKYLDLVQRKVHGVNDLTTMRPAVELGAWPMDELHGDSPVDRKYDHNVEKSWQGYPLK